MGSHGNQKTVLDAVAILRKSGLCRRKLSRHNDDSKIGRNPFVNQVFVVNTDQWAVCVDGYFVAIPS